MLHCYVFVFLDCTWNKCHPFYPLRRRFLCPLFMPRLPWDLAPCMNWPCPTNQFSFSLVWKSIWLLGLTPQTLGTWQCSHNLLQRRISYVFFIWKELWCWQLRYPGAEAGSERMAAERPVVTCTGTKNQAHIRSTKTLNAVGPCFLGAFI